MISGDRIFHSWLLPGASEIWLWVSKPRDPETQRPGDPAGEGFTEQALLPRWDWANKPPVSWRAAREVAHDFWTAGLPRTGSGVGLATVAHLAALWGHHNEGCGGQRRAGPHSPTVS